MRAGPDVMSGCKDLPHWKKQLSSSSIIIHALGLTLKVKGDGTSQFSSMGSNETGLDYTFIQNNFHRRSYAVYQAFIFY